MLAAILACRAETTGDPRPMRILYSASESAERGKSPSAALDMMEAVAEGKRSEAILAAAMRAGLQEFLDQNKGVLFKPTDYAVRAFAMEMIGRTRLPDALVYLSQITPEKVGRDESRSVYPAAQVALNKALLRREVDPQRQIAFLELQLTSARVGQVALWAQEELCDRGSLGSMDLIERFVKRLDASRARRREGGVLPEANGGHQQ